MNLSLELGVTVALVCAFVTNLAFLLKHRGAVAAPPVDVRRPLASAAGLFRLPSRFLQPHRRATEKSLRA